MTTISKDVERDARPSRSEIAVSQEPRKINTQGVLVMHAIVLVCLISVCVTVLFGALDVDLVYASATIFAGVTVWIVISWRLAFGSFFNPYILFVVSAAIFNGGDTFLEIIGLNRNGILAGKLMMPLLCVPSCSVR